MGGGHASGSAQGRRDGTAGREPANPVVGRIGDVDCARAVHRQARRVVELGGGGQGSVAAKSRDSRSGGRADFAVGRYPADAVALELRDIQNAGGVHHDVAGREELRRGGRAAIATRAFDAAAGHRGDGSVRRHAPYAVVAKIGDVEIPGRVGCQPVGQVELCGRGGSAIAAETGLAGSRNGGNHPQRRPGQLSRRRLGGLLRPVSQLRPTLDHQCRWWISCPTCRNGAKRRRAWAVCVSRRTRGGDGRSAPCERGCDRCRSAPTFAVC